MITEEILKKVIEDQKFAFAHNKTIPRELEIATRSKFVVVISGVRRCGKSTLLLQKLQSVKNKLFVNFEDTRLGGFDLNDFTKLEEIAQKEKLKVFIFDEIQNIEGWEKFVRTVHDKGYHIFITGSNASMLSKELGTRLTGRYIQSELFPFSYTEFLIYNKQKANLVSLKNYLSKGGFPEFLQTNNEEYLRTLFRDIVIRDIAVRRNIRNEHLLLKLGIYLISNLGKEISFNSLTKTLNIKSVRTTIDYCNYLKESYLFDFINRFSYSVKQQQVNPQKVYAVDTGMARTNSLSLSDDLGRMFENMVFLALRRNYNDITYYKDEKSECDFIIRKQNKVVLAVQVCWHLTADNLNREIQGIKNALSFTGAEKGIIITANQDETIDDIRVIPFWKWSPEVA